MSYSQRAVVDLTALRPSRTPVGGMEAKLRGDRAINEKRQRYREELAAKEARAHDAAAAGSLAASQVVNEEATPIITVPTERDLDSTTDRQSQRMDETSSLERHVSFNLSDTNNAETEAAIPHGARGTLASQAKLVMSPSRFAGRASASEEMGGQLLVPIRTPVKGVLQDGRHVISMDGDTVVVGGVKVEPLEVSRRRDVPIDTAKEVILDVEGSSGAGRRARKAMGQRPWSAGNRYVTLERPSRFLSSETTTKRTETSTVRREGGTPAGSGRLQSISDNSVGGSTMSSPTVVDSSSSSNPPTAGERVTIVKTIETVTTTVTRSTVEPARAIGRTVVGFSDPLRVMRNTRSLSPPARPASAQSMSSVSLRGGPPRLDRSKSKAKPSTIPRQQPALENTVTFDSPSCGHVVQLGLAAKGDRLAAGAGGVAAAGSPLQAARRKRYPCGFRPLSAKKE